MMNILRLWHGDVNRWHSYPSRLLRNSGDTIHAHSARCAILLLHLKPSATAQELASCILHDAGETLTGDTPYGAKRRWKFPDTSDADRELGVSVACGPWLKLVDNLDAYLWMVDCDRPLMRAPEWRKMRADMLGAADDLGCMDEVLRMISEAEHGAA